MREGAWRRDHEPVGAANRASRAIALGAAALRPKASAVPHVVTLVAIRSLGLRESRRAPRKPSVFAAPPDTNRAYARHERIATLLPLLVALQGQNGLGALHSSTFPLLHSSTIPIPRSRTSRPFYS